VNRGQLKPSKLSDTQTRELSVGEELRFARERKGVSRKDAAIQLCLSESYISALEEDNRAKLPAPAYVKGYIRSYGRLLGLSTDLLIQKYDQSLPEQTTEKDVPSLSPKKLNIKYRELYPKKRFSFFNLFSVLIVGSIVLSSFFYWQVGDYNGSPKIGLRKVSVEGANGRVVVEDFSDIENDIPHTILDQQSSAADVSESAQKNEPTENVVSETADSAMSNETSDSISNSLVEFVDSITLQAKEQCWVKVTDSNGGMLHVALMRPGELKKLSGTAPFEVVLGNVKGVTLSFNGEEVDLEAYHHSQSRVAVVKLGS
jgi:cytoskeleton protein RodZ